MRLLTSLVAAATLAAFGACADEQRPTPPPTPSSGSAPATATASATATAATAAPPSTAGAATSAGAGSFVPKRIAVEAKAMGTHVLVASYTTTLLNEEALKPKLDRAIEEIRRLEALMTTWRDDSEVSRINAAAGKEAIAVGPETFAVLEKSLWISKESGGVFDVTFEAMKGLWRFDNGGDDKIPDKAAVETARKKIDYRKIELDAGKHTVFLKGAGMKMNLGGIAKGYAVDAAAKVLEREGVAAFFVQAGGDLYVRGRKPDGAFKVGVRDPRAAGCGPTTLGKECYFAMIEVEDHSFSTAGDYERSFVKAGKRYHHIIDPRTGFPATAARSVTIWAKDALTADAIDDAVFIMGPDKGLALVESIDDCGAVIVDAKNKVWISKRLKDKVWVSRQPTDGI